MPCWYRDGPRLQVKQGMQQGVGKPYSGVLVFFDAKSAEAQGHRLLFAIVVAIVIGIYNNTPNARRLHEKALDHRLRRKGWIA